MEREVHFSYQSIGNFVKLLATIQYEKNHDPTEIAIWHERFDDEDGDALFEEFLGILFPEGKTIQVEDITTIVNYASHFLEKDKKARGIINKYKKLRNPYWVYFKIDDVVYPCDFGNHSRIVYDVCTDYFKGFEEIDDDYLGKFIRENFEIHSDNTTIEKISKDTFLIRTEILMNTALMKEAITNSK